MRLIFLLLSAALTLSVMSGCAVKSSNTSWDVDVSFADSALMSSRLSAGNSVIMLPIIVKGRFDTLSSEFAQRNSRVLKETQSAFDPGTQKDLEAAWKSAYFPPSIDAFYKRIFDEDMLALAASDSAWKIVPSHYLMVTRFLGGISIHGTEQRHKRRATISCEIWDARLQGVVWRAKAKGYVMDTQVGDADFILDGMRSLYQKLPSVFPVVNSERW